MYEKNAGLFIDILYVSAIFQAATAQKKFGEASEIFKLTSILAKHV